MKTSLLMLAFGLLVALKPANGFAGCNQYDANCSQIPMVLAVLTNLMA